MSCHQRIDRFLSVAFLLAIGLLASSCGGATEAATDVTVTEPNQRPTAAISSPTEGATFDEGDPVQFQGSGSDPEDGALTGASLVWTSDVDGQIGTGTAFTKSDLSVGTHVITLTTTDSDGATGTASVSITVNGIPLSSAIPSPPITIGPGINTIVIVVTSSDGSTQTYVIIVDRTGPQGQEAYLKASNTEADEWFGYRVSVDGNVIVVGAWHEDSVATGVNGNQADNSTLDSGAAYVFRRTGGVWAQEAYLKASNTEASDQFGRSVSVSGDVIVVGAWAEDSAATGVNGSQADNAAVNRPLGRPGDRDDAPDRHSQRARRCWLLGG